MSDQPEPTSQERIAKFKDWVHTKAAPKNAVPLKEGSNILLAAAFHGLARHSGGATNLTMYEQLGVDFFKALAGNDDEVLRAYGDICVEAKTLARAGNFLAANTPLSVMGLSNDAPYTTELYTKDFNELGAEATRQPHIRAITPEQIDSEGNLAATSGFTAASTQLGREVTVFTLNQEDMELYRSETVRSTWYSFKCEGVRFTCHRRSGELGKDEVYFTWGFGGDGRAEVSHRTPEFGSVKAGNVRDFPRNPPIYAGHINKGFAGHMICWEADHSNSEWYNKLILAMNEIARRSSDMAVSVGDANWDFLIGLVGPVGQVNDVIFWIENISTLVAAFLDLFRNQDDMVKECSYAFSKAFVARAHGSEQNWRFDGGGGGNHTVAVRFEVISSWESVTVTEPAKASGELPN
ncbi:uncharacterized protein PG998_000088 [Apiospora kogelbergensis]|uniref:uncharacterized protein n=1 Tax=Apiospora kogelbergensis TaxID=1337665 RepID=UPI00312E63CF